MCADVTRPLHSLALLRNASPRVREVERNTIVTEPGDEKGANGVLGEDVEPVATQELGADELPPEWDRTAPVTMDRLPGAPSADPIADSLPFWREFNESFDGILWVATADLSRSLYVSPGAAQVFERSPEEFGGRGSWVDWVHPDDQEQVREAGRRLQAGARVDLEYRFVLPDGTVRWLGERAFPIWDRSGRVARTAGIAEDITARKSQARKRIQRREDLLRRILDLIPHAIFVIDSDGRFLLVNEVTARGVGMTVRELTGKSAVELGQEPEATTRAMLRQVIDEGREILDREERYQDATGEEVVVRMSRVPLRMGTRNQPAMLGIAVDITAERAAEDALRERAFYDPLTGLPNRDLFVQRLQHALERRRRRDAPGFGVLFMDLDSFKEINDTLGHLVGDQLLVAVAHRLTGCVRPGDTVSRFGGDEFAVLVEDVNEGEACRTVARRIHSAMREAFELAGERHVLSTSVGIALSRASEDSSDDLLRDADTAMYHAKSRGPGRTQLFSQELAEKSRREVRLKAELREALEQDQFVLHYQPILELQGQTIVGLEALIRWNHPEHGFLMPFRFLDVAESAQLMPDLDRWVLRSAAKTIRSWVDAGILGDRRISVNVSAQHLAEPGFVPYVDLLVREFDLPTRNVMVELTESSFIRNAVSTRNALQGLREMGIKVALDDFGTGYSSLSHLHTFPIDVLKIDRSFVSGVLDDPKQSAIVRATVQLGRDLGLTVTAEGVDDPEQTSYLKGLGCQCGQGWLWDKALPVDEVAKRLAGSGYETEESGDDT